MTDTLSLEQKPAAAITSPTSVLRNHSFCLLWIGEGISLTTPVMAQGNSAACGGNAHTALAMGLAVIVMSTLKTLDINTGISRLGLRLAALALANFQE